MIGIHVSLLDVLIIDVFDDVVEGGIDVWFSISIFKYEARAIPTS